MCRRVVSREIEMKKQLKFVQIITGQWSSEDGRQFTLIGLTATGAVYRYVHSIGGWLPFTMDEVHF